MNVFPLLGSPAIITHEKKKNPAITSKSDNETMGREGGCEFQFQKIIFPCLVLLPLWVPDLLCYDNDRRHFERLFKS